MQYISKFNTLRIKNNIFTNENTTPSSPNKIHPDSESFLVYHSTENIQQSCLFRLVRIRFTVREPIVVPCDSERRSQDSINFCLGSVSPFGVPLLSRVIQITSETRRSQDSIIRDPLLSHVIQITSDTRRSQDIQEENPFQHDRNVS